MDASYPVGLVCTNVSNVPDLSYPIELMQESQHGEPLLFPTSAEVEVGGPCYSNITCPSGWVCRPITGTNQSTCVGGMDGFVVPVPFINLNFDADVSTLDLTQMNPTAVVTIQPGNTFTGIAVNSSGAIFFADYPQAALSIAAAQHGFALYQAYNGVASRCTAPSTCDSYITVYGVKSTELACLQACIADAYCQMYTWYVTGASSVVSFSSSYAGYCYGQNFPTNEVWTIGNYYMQYPASGTLQAGCNSGMMQGEWLSSSHNMSRTGIVDFSAGEFFDLYNPMSYARATGNWASIFSNCTSNCNAVLPIIGGNEVSIEMWVYVGGSRGAPIFDFGTASATDVITFKSQNDASFVLQIYNGGTLVWQAATASGAISRATWSHVVLLIGLTKRIVVNGVSLSLTITAASPSTALPFVVRHHSFLARSNTLGDRFTPMRLDLFRVYDVALTMSQIRTLYNSPIIWGTTSPVIQTGTNATLTITGSNLNHSDTVLQFYGIPVDYSQSQPFGSPTLLCQPNNNSVASGNWTVTTKKSIQSGTASGTFSAGAGNANVATVSPLSFVVPSDFVSGNGTFMTIHFVTGNNPSSSPYFSLNILGQMALYTGGTDQFTGTATTTDMVLDLGPTGTALVNGLNFKAGQTVPFYVQILYPGWYMTNPMLIVVLNYTVYNSSQPVASPRFSSMQACTLPSSLQPGSYIIGYRLLNSSSSWIVPTNARVIITNATSYATSNLIQPNQALADIQNALTSASVVGLKVNYFIPPNALPAGVPPSVPTGVIASLTSPTSVHITFAAGSSNGGTISFCTATAIPSGIVGTGTGSASPISINALPFGSSFTFFVACVNEYGVGASARSNLISTPGVPAVPSLSNLTLLSTTTVIQATASALVSFITPLSAGLPLLNCSVIASSLSSQSQSVILTYSNASSSSDAGAIQTVILSSLTWGLHYNVSVSCSNAAGSSGVNSLLPLYVAAVPDTPTFVAGHYTSSQNLSISFLVTSSNGAPLKSCTASPIPGNYSWTIFISNSDSLFDQLPTAYSIMMSPLSLSDRFKVSVRCANELGSSDPSTPISPCRRCCGLGVALRC